MCVYLFADTRASINTHYTESQLFRELLTLLGDLQSQLSGRSHDYSCGGGGKQDENTDSIYYVLLFWALPFSH